MSDKKLLIKAVSFGTLSGFLITIILLCCASLVIMTSGLLPGELTDWISVALLGFGAFSGGCITAKITKSAGLIVGLFTAILMLVIVTAIGMIKGNDSLSAVTAVRAVAMLLLGSAGGILGIRKKEKIKI